jgi:hypothetical protein
MEAGRLTRKVAPPAPELTSILPLRLQTEPAKAPADNEREADAPRGQVRRGGQTG